MRALLIGIAIVTATAVLSGGCRRSASDDDVPKRSAKPSAADAKDADGDGEDDGEAPGSWKVPGDPTTFWVPGSPHNVFIGQAPEGARSKPKSHTRGTESTPVAPPVGAESRNDGVQVRTADRMQPGYTLFIIHRSAKAVLVDDEGTILRTWSDPGAQMWDDAELLPNGNLVVVGGETTTDDVKGVSDEARYCAGFAWDGEALWRRNNLAHHDIGLGPDGNLLTLTYERRIEPAVHESVELRDDAVTLLSPDGDVVKSLTLYAPIAAKPEMFPLLPVEPSHVGGHELVNLFQTSSVDRSYVAALASENPLYTPSAAIVTFRRQNRVAIFDLESGELLWAWGQDELSGPNDAQVLANGHVLVFDNGVDSAGSRVIEVDPKNGEIVWTYEGDPPSSFHTEIKGSAQRLANGDTLITNADDGEIIEVTSDGEIVWRYLGLDRSRGKRAPIAGAQRYDSAMIDALRD